MFPKVQLPFLSYMNCKGPYLVKGFLYNFYPFFDSAFTQLGVITKTSNKFVEIVAFTERYLILTHVKNKELKKKPLRITFHEISYWKNFNKKENITSHLIYNIVSWSKMAL